MLTKEELLNWQNSEELQLKAVRQEKYSIQYIHDPSENVQLEAVKQDGHLIRFIDDPSENVQLEAIKQNGFSIQFIHNPSKNVCQKLLDNCDDLDRMIMYIDILKSPELYEKYLKM